MNIFIFADLEGISGVYCRDQVLPESPRFHEGRMFLTREINITAAACKAAGVEKIYVRDGHGAGYSVLYEQLSNDIDFIIQGPTRERFPGLEDCDAVILLGYHAMAGTPRATLEHSMSSVQIQNYWINDVKSGEIAIDAFIAGDAGKPVILVSGDDKACAEAREAIPGVYTAQVKTGLSSFSAMMLTPERAKKVLTEAVTRAVQNWRSVKPVKASKPIRFRVELMERGQIPSEYEKPYMSVLDGRTYEVVGDTMEQALTRSW